MNSKKTEEIQKFSRVVQVLLPLFVVVCAVLAFLWMLETSPKAKPRKKGPNSVLVEVEPLRTISQKISITGMGTVQPALEVELKARVAGEIVSMHKKVIPGGYVKKGDVLFQLDPTDYEITARQLASEVKKAENNLEIERGNQLVAMKEFQLLGEKVRPEEKNLILRQPQLKNLIATLETARARYEKAQIDIQRTTIRAPFNGVIQSRFVNTGSQVNTSTPLVHLVGTDEFWVEVTLPVKKIRWLNIPDERSALASPALVTSDSSWGEGMERRGEVVRLAADLEEKGRLAKLLVSVKDPLLVENDRDNRPLLLIGSFVEVTLEGRKLNDLIVVKRKNVHDGKYLWLMDEEKKLHIHKIDIIYKDHDQVFITGVRAGELVIVSNISVAAEGLPLRIGKNNGLSSKTGKEERRRGKGGKMGQGDEIK